jgi:hypothetical protein
LQQNGIDSNIWCEAAVRLSNSCAQQLDIDAANKDVMDLRHYVHMKRIPGNSAMSSESFPGVPRAAVILTHPSHAFTSIKQVL